MSILENVVIAEAPTDNPKRDAIVTAATRLFLESGYANVSMDAIADAAGVSKRTVYSHFSAKDVLFAAVMSDLCGKLVGPCPLGDQWLGHPREVLTIIGRWIASLFTAPEAVALYRVVVSESIRVPELGQIFMETGPKCIADAIAGYLEDQTERNMLHVADPAIAASQFMEMISGPVHLPLLLNLSKQPTADTLDRVVKRTVEMFLAAYRPQ